MLTVYPPVRGIRHYVKPGEPRTLCGKNCELWNADLKGGEASCRACRTRAGKTTGVTFAQVRRELKKARAADRKAREQGHDFFSEKKK